MICTHIVYRMLTCRFWNTNNDVGVMQLSVSLPQYLTIANLNKHKAWL